MTRFYFILQFGLLHLLLGFPGPQTFAQVDPSAAILLRPRSGQVPNQEDLDSSRYTVKPPSSSNFTTPQTSSPPEPPKEAAQESVEVDEPDSDSSEESTNEASANLDSDKNNTSLTPDETGQKGVSDRMRRLLLGGSEEDIRQYLDQLHPYDARVNILELDLAPTYFYNDSSSAYWFRDYYNSGIGVELAAKVWMTPFFGIRAGYFTSLTTEISATPTTQEYSPVEHQMFRAGIRFRNYFGLSRLAPSLIIGLDYDDYRFKVPPDSTQRTSIQTSGARISIESHLPTSAGYRWTLGLSLIPWADHQEEESAVTIESGENNDTDILGLSIGGIWSFDRRSQVFWKISHRIEKNLFDGESNPVNPTTQQAVDGTAINNGLSMFQLGFTWGH